MYIVPITATDDLLYRVHNKLSTLWRSVRYYLALPKFISILLLWRIFDKYGYIQYINHNKNYKYELQKHLDRCSN